MTYLDAYLNLVRRQTAELARWAALPENAPAVAEALAGASLEATLSAREGEFAATALVAAGIGHPRSEIMLSEFALFEDLAEAA